MRKKIRVLTVADTFSRDVPVLDPQLSYRAEDVVRTLDPIRPQIGYAKTIRADQGSEFVSRDLDLWAYIGAWGSLAPVAIHGVARSSPRASLSTSPSRPIGAIAYSFGVSQPAR